MGCLEKGSLFWCGLAKKRSLAKARRRNSLVVFLRRLPAWCFAKKVSRKGAEAQFPCCVFKAVARVVLREKGSLAKARRRNSLVVFLRRLTVGCFRKKVSRKGGGAIPLLCF